MAQHATASSRRRRPLRYLAEVVRALVVVALVFLNFGHSLSFAAQPDYALQSVCGDTHLDGDAGHADHHNLPCHACRIGGGADLPPLPADMIAVLAVVSDTVYLAAPLLPHAAVPQRAGSPRGPPEQA